MSDLFVPKGSEIGVNLSVEDKALLIQIPGLLASVEHGVEDPADAVINRPAYRNDDEASAEFSNLVRSQRDRDLAEDLEVIFELTSDKATITINQARGALRVINAARLALAARSGAFDNGANWELEVSTSPALAAVAWLGYVQSELVGVLTDVENQVG